MADNLISRIYENFRGVDFRGEEINLSRSPDSLNVWKDYKETESIRTRPTMKLEMVMSEENKNVKGIFFFDYVNSFGVKKTVCFVQCGNKLFECDKELNSKKELCSGFTNRIKAFACENKIYFIGGMYLVYDTSTGKLTRVKGYVPTTSIGRKPSGGGTVYEDVNLLTNRRKNTFLADGESKEYYVDSEYISMFDEEELLDAEQFGGLEGLNLDDYKTEEEKLEALKQYYKPVVKVNDNTVTNFTVDYAKGCIKFDEAPPKPLTDGQDNVSIEFTKMSSGKKSFIKYCTLIETFDNRIFFSGNQFKPNTVWHCSLNDPTYVSDLDYYNEGLETTAVKSMVAGNNSLWVFKEPSTENTSVFYHTPTIDSEYGKIYPSEHSSIAIGCVGGAINFNDDIVFFSQNGMEGMNGDITTEQAVAHRSSLVDRKLRDMATTDETAYKNMKLVEWNGYLLVFVGRYCFLADSRAKFTNVEHYEYEWFYWEFDKTITCATVYDGVLYLGANSGDGTGSIYTLKGNDAVESYWTTPKDKFKYPQYQKTTNKRGCVVEATGDISISVKTDKTDFELIGDYTNIVDYFVSRIKRKKFKDIQLKFHSNTRFSLETATLECFIGGYIKR
jgi:hypothetical protein